MIMPYGTKPTQQPAGGGAPDKVDFDVLWDTALRPGIEAAGYDPVRADQDIGASIIKEMIERLAGSDLVVADLSIPNGNVYYEIGVRHAAVQRGCVLVSAAWATPLFDVAQMRQIRYPLPAEKIDDVSAAEVKRLLQNGIPQLAQGDSPVWEALPGYPPIDRNRASSFRDALRELSAFQASVTAARVSGTKEDRRTRALALRDQYAGTGPLQSIVALDLLYLLRDCADWQTLLDFIDTGLQPRSLAELSVVREQRALALSKLGRHEEAIGLLQELVKETDTSERRGLLGGRYKALYEAATDPSAKARYLDSAIEEYERGMRLDLNDYYPSSNLPSLYLTRNDDGDTDLAAVAGAVTMVACQRAEARNADDPWLKPTLIVAAFNAGDVATARALAKRIRREGAVDWQLGTALVDMQRALGFHDGAVNDGLSAILADLRSLV
jgi:tetratricopeptide (TPR) repeat protein